jgi:hypothetical protein
MACIEIEKNDLPNDLQKIFDMIQEKVGLFLVSYFKKYNYNFKNVVLESYKYKEYSQYSFIFKFLNDEIKREIWVDYANKDIIDEEKKHIFFITIFDENKSYLKIDDMEVNRFLCDKENKSEKELFYLESYEGDKIGEKLENMFRKWIELFEKHLKGILQGDDLIDGYQIDIGY